MLTTLAERFSPDAVVLDIGLPGIDGYEIARRLRRDGQTVLVLIALTGWGQPEDKQRASEAGFDHHFTKPIDPDALLAIFRNAGRGGSPAR